MKTQNDMYEIINDAICEAIILISNILADLFCIGINYTHFAEKHEA